MKPVFKEEMEFLGIPNNLENILWVESRCYYGFDKKFNKIKFGRDINKLPKTINELITHKEYCNYYYKNFTSKLVEDERNKLYKYINNNNYDEIIISISGGKDSTVAEHMVRDICEKHNKVRILFGNTTNETHYTYKYVKEMYGNKLEICNPNQGFYNWCLSNNFIPTKFGRACCSIFKEGNITPYLSDKYDKKLLHICGIRRDESNTRSKYNQIRKGKWENKKAQENWNMYLPIIDFLDLDVWSYLIYFNIPFNPLYKFGYSRVGCTNCPYRSDYELLLNKHFLPTYYNHWQKILKQVFINEGLAITLNCTLDEYLNGDWRGTIAHSQPTKEVIQDFANLKGISFDEAKKYFKTNRCSCGKRLSKDVIALNMKLLGRNTDGRMCLKCLAEFFGTTKQELKNQIKEFKQQGCNLF